jgi:hypothetical protein
MGVTVMSYGIQSSSAAGAASRVAEPSTASRRRERTADADDVERSSQTHGVRGRHALVEALSEALSGLMPAAPTTSGTADVSNVPAEGAAGKQALHEFAHALFSALRPSGGVDGSRGRGFAWGHTSGVDLAQRLEALAQGLRGDAPPAVPVTTPTTPTTAATAATTPAPNPVTAPAAATATAATATPRAVAPDAATPATGVVANESPLLVAFKHLAAALNGSAATGATSVSAADQLAALLHRMAQALKPDSGADLPASGSLIDVTA